VHLKLLDAAGSDAAAIFRHFGVDSSRLQKELERSLDKLKSGNARTPVFSPHLVTMLSQAWTLASLEFGAAQIRSGHTILALVGEREGPEVLRQSAEFTAGVRSVVAGLSEMSNFLTSVATSYQDMDQSIASKITR